MCWLPYSRALLHGLVLAALIGIPVPPLLAEEKRMDNPLLAPITAEELRTCFRLRQLLVVKNKDLESFLPIARLYIREALAKAAQLEATNAEGARGLRSFARMVAFNLGADAWPGWDDGLEITPALLDAGMAAARLNLELAEMLKEDNRKLGNAHWLIGAHHLARERYADARQEFTAFHQLSQGDSDSELLASGYLALADWLETGEPQAQKHLHDVRESLKATGGEEVLWKQLETSERVFGSPR